MPETTNDDLLAAIERGSAALVAHTQEDHAVATAQQQVNEEVKKSLAELHLKMQSVASKKDIKDVKNFMKKVKIGANVVNFGWNNSSKIGGFALLIAAAVVLLKMGLVGAVNLIIGR